MASGRNESDAYTYFCFQVGVGVSESLVVGVGGPVFLHRISDKFRRGAFHENDANSASSVTLDEGRGLGLGVPEWRAYHLS